jgi:hypothetical protein
MNSFEHSTTVTEPSGRVLFRLAGSGQCAESLPDEQLREQIKDNVLSELKWDIQLFRTR